MNMIDFGMAVQHAGDSPRFRHAGGSVLLESAFDGSLRSALGGKGHHIASAIDAWGGYQGIVIDPRSGVLMGGSDPRKDGLAIGWSNSLILKVHSHRFITREDLTSWHLVRNLARLRGPASARTRTLVKPESLAPNVKHRWSPHA